MIVKKELLQAYLDKHEMTAATLAREMGIDEKEIQTLLNGGAASEATARRFIYHLGADEAVKLIDWAAIGRENPLSDEGSLPLKI